MADVEVFDQEARGESVGTNGEGDCAFAPGVFTNRLVEKDMVVKVAHRIRSACKTDVKHQSLDIDRHRAIAEVVVREISWVCIEETGRHPIRRWDCVVDPAAAIPSATFGPVAAR